MRVFFLRDDDSGFTAVEVITVLVIVAILAAFAISKAMSPGQYSAVSEAEILKANLRFAQIKSMGEANINAVPIRQWGINVGGGSYTLTCAGTNCPAPMPALPGDNSSTHTFLRVTAAPATSIVFDSWGSPGPTTLSINLTPTDGSQAQPVTVTRNTGFIQ